MEARELRIGNYVQSSVLGVCEVYSIYQDRFDVTTDGKSKVWFVGLDTEPIPLTEDWLVKFGFEFDIDTESWSKLISLEQTDFLFEIFDYEFFYLYNMTRIKYVHQLQNLYFALTGEELKII